MCWLFLVYGNAGPRNEIWIDLINYNKLLSMQVANLEGPESSPSLIQSGLGTLRANGY